MVTDDLRAVTRPISYQRQIGATAGFAQPFAVTDYADVVVKVQRRYRVQVGEPKHAMQEAPPYDKASWTPLPGQPLVWVAMRDEWRDLGAVGLSEVAAERAASGAKPTISTNA